MGKRGPQPLKPSEKDRKFVARMAACGIREAEIAKVLSIDPKTLRKHFRRELDVSLTERKAVIAECLFQKARKGNVSAQIFFLKTQAGWSEKTALEISGPGGGPVRTMASYDNLSDEQLDQLSDLLHKAAARPG